MAFRPRQVVSHSEDDAPRPQGAESASAAPTPTPAPPVSAPAPVAATPAPARSGGLFNRNGPSAAPAAPRPLFARGAASPAPAASDGNAPRRPFGRGLRAEAHSGVSVAPEAPKQGSVEEAQESTPPRQYSRSFTAPDLSPQIIHPTNRHGYERRLQVGRYATRRPDGLPLMLERYIDAVAEHRKITPEQRERTKVQAAAQPERALEKFREMFENEVLPLRRRALDWTVDAPQDDARVQVILVQDGTFAERFWDREKAGPYAYLDRAALVAKSVAETPFAQKPEIFARMVQRKWGQSSDDAFSETAEEATPPTSSGPSP